MLLQKIKLKKKKKACINAQREKTTIVKRGNKRRLTFTPGKSPRPKKTSAHAARAPGKTRDTFKSRVIAAVTRGDYHAAVGHILSSSYPATREAVCLALAPVLKREISELSSDGGFSQALTSDTLAQFSWDKLTEECMEKAPTVSKLLRDILPAPTKITSHYQLGPNNSKRCLNIGEAEALINKRLGLVMAVALFTKSPRKNTFIQSCIGVELWRQGCSEKIFRTLNHLGISQGLLAARGHVDMLRKSHVSDLTVWKSDIQDFERGSRPQAPKGFSTGWDNVQITSHGKHGGTQGGNKFLIWGMCFTVQNRVPTLHFQSQDVIPAMEQSPYSFLPSPTDYDRLRARMVFVVERILAAHLPILQSTAVPAHLKHAFSEELASASNTVSLGVVSANPSTTDGVVQIMKHLQQFLPEDNKGNFHPVICNGDNLSVEKMRSSRRATANGLSPAGRLEGLEECPQEFHKEALLLQDFMNKFFSGKSLTSRGTLSHLKIMFGHKTLKQKVMTNFKAAWEMIEFCVVAYIVLLALQISGMTSLQDVPAGCSADSSPKEKRAWLHQVAMQLVETCWLPPSTEDIRRCADAIQRNEPNESTGEIFPFCKCQTDKEEKMIRCCNSTCRQQWFHVGCVDGGDKAEEGECDWYCSQECTDSPGNIYCFCERKLWDAKMVQCSLAVNCRRKEWYHLSCIAKTAELPEVWFCCDECALDAGEDDGVLNYSKSLVWDGLNLLARRDAVREGDGPAMIQHWKMDMIQFWESHHNKYFVSGCQLLAAVGGSLPERLRADLVWNRVANIHGDPGRNIGLDLLNEFMNNDFKEMLKHSRGNYTDQQVARVAEMSGAYGKQLDALFTEAGLGDLQTKSYHRHGKWFEKDLEKFIEVFQADALFDYFPPRAHKGYETFTSKHLFRTPQKMGQKISQWATEMDFGGAYKPT